MPKIEATMTMDRPATAATRLFLTGSGRGSRGKTTYLRYRIEQMLNQGREVVIVDADVLNPSLSGYFPQAKRPVSGEPVDIRDLLVAEINALAESGASLVVDFGAGDRVLTEFGRELDLVDLCEAIGVEPEAAHLLGPDLDDLEHVMNIERQGHFRPRRSSLILNGKEASGSTPIAAFQGVMTSLDWQRLTDPEGRACTPRFMPKLPCLAKLDAQGIGLFAALDPETKGRDGKRIGPVENAMAIGWHKKMAEAHKEA